MCDEIKTIFTCISDANSGSKRDMLFNIFHVKCFSRTDQYVNSLTGLLLHVYNIFSVLGHISV